MALHYFVLPHSIDLVAGGANACIKNRRERWAYNLTCTQFSIPFDFFSKTFTRSSIKYVLRDLHQLVNTATRNITN